MSAPFEDQGSSFEVAWEGKMNLTSLSPKAGARRRRTRIGLGEGSGHGQTATKGQKGQRSRSGDGKMAGFEGGQTPLLRRIPKFGFSNAAFTKRYQIVSLTDIERVFKNQKEVTLESLKMHGLISSKLPVKILGGKAEIKNPYKISVHAFSASSRAQIEKAGGVAVVIGG